MIVDDLTIKWRYSSKSYVKNVQGIKEFSCLITTSCDIYRNKVIIASGSVGCHSNDSFNKNTGRIKSLADALSVEDVSSGQKVKIFDKKLRARIWTVYRLMTKKPRW